MDEGIASLLPKVGEELLADALGWEAPENRTDVLDGIVSSRSGRAADRKRNGCLRRVGGRVIPCGGRKAMRRRLGLDFRAGVCLGDGPTLLASLLARAVQQTPAVGD